VLVVDEVNSPVAAAERGVLTRINGSGMPAVAAVQAGLVASRVSRRVGLGAGSIIGGRVTLLLDPGALSGLAVGRRIVVVSGTNGKTTTSHLLAAAADIRACGPQPHRDLGVRLSYAGLDHHTEPDPVAALALLVVPPSPSSWTLPVYTNRSPASGRSGGPGPGSPAVSVARRASCSPGGTR
jgi:hypothetical protein